MRNRHTNKDLGFALQRKLDAPSALLTGVTFGKSDVDGIRQRELDEVLDGVILVLVGHEGVYTTTRGLVNNLAASEQT